MFEILTPKRVKKEIEGFDYKAKEKILEIVLLLKSDPVPAKSLNVAKLAGTKNCYRIRFQKIRILYKVEWERKIIELSKIEYRKSRTYDSF